MHQDLMNESRLLITGNECLNLMSMAWFLWSLKGLPVLRFISENKVFPWIFRCAVMVHSFFLQILAIAIKINRYYLMHLRIKKSQWAILNKAKLFSPQAQPKYVSRVKLTRPPYCFKLIEDLLVKLINVLIMRKKI